MKVNKRHKQRALLILLHQHLLAKRQDWLRVELIWHTLCFPQPLPFFTVFNIICQQVSTGRGLLFETLIIRLWWSLVMPCYRRVALLLCSSEAAAQVVFAVNCTCCYSENHECCQISQDWNPEDYSPPHQLVAHFASHLELHRLCTVGLSEAVCCKQLPAAAAGNKVDENAETDPTQNVPENQNMSNNEAREAKKLCKAARLVIKHHFLITGCHLIFC